MRTGSGRPERIMLTPLTIGFLMKYLVFLFCLFAAASAFSQEVINYDQASLHLDSYVTVCGKVAQVVNKGDHSFINFGATYPNQKFVLYITISVFLTPAGTFYYLQSLAAIAKKAVSHNLTA